MSDTLPVPQLNLTQIILIPVAVAVGVVLVVHLVFSRCNPRVKDSGMGEVISAMQKDSEKHDNTDAWLQNNPPVLANFPPTAIPCFEAADGCRVSQGGSVNEFVLDFQRDAFVSVQANAPMSSQINCMEIHVKADNPATVVAMGLARKPYPSWRLPGWHPHSVAYCTNGRRFVDRGGYVGERFLIAPNEDVSVAKNLANTYYLVVNHTASEVYLVQGAEPVMFNRILANKDEFRGQKHQYFPTIGANGKCQVRVVMYEYPADEVMRDAHNQERMYHAPDAPAVGRSLSHDVQHAGNAPSAHPHGIHPPAPGQVNPYGMQQFSGEPNTIAQLISSGQIPAGGPPPRI